MDIDLKVTVSASDDPNVELTVTIEQLDYDEVVAKDDLIGRIAKRFRDAKVFIDKEAT